MKAHGRVQSRSCRCQPPALSAGELGPRLGMASFHEEPVDSLATIVTRPAGPFLIIATSSLFHAIDLIFRIPISDKTQIIGVHALLLIFGLQGRFRMIRTSLPCRSRARSVESA